MYDRINPLILRDLPKAIFDHQAKKGKIIYQKTIYNEIIEDLYFKNIETYKEHLKPEKVLRKNKNGKRKAFTKGWFTGFSKKYDFKLEKKKNVNGHSIVTSIRINGKTIRKEDC